MLVVRWWPGEERCSSSSKGKVATAEQQQLANSKLQETVDEGTDYLGSSR